ncbi:hypothetical protein [Yersinia ruckeri]|uniref:hypothetical protein n=1 Tax=Yersinia ruckeri TaxID=29486 RepID=UPI000538BDB8|nr:hypothetical protein [Yersinia ruckeri]AKA37426.1 GTP-binding protein [Yersinia ruckeri]AUQ42811.1 hypothetical protein NJ56_13380 [Yersinia ruckeri]EKN3360997.1 hypothetical protein [Yersinia ruckeri]EKN3363460.1 hypothetical protein [Yersinia ruckeri]EKN4199045.1 hypothetical protein [Yersinia ruckeri]
MKPEERIELTLARIKFIAEVSQVAQCNNKEFLLAMSFISDLTDQIVVDPNDEAIFYNADSPRSH